MYNAVFSYYRESLGKLALNDSSFHYEAETSAALGFGFRCGCLGLLHLEIVQERLNREFDLDLITTAPSVVYRLNLVDGQEMTLHNPADYPTVQIKSVQEPWIKATIIVPDEYLGQFSHSARSGVVSKINLPMLAVGQWQFIICR